MTSFVECETCNAKPGSPVLCDGCLKNRETISAFEQQNRVLKEQLSIWKRKAGENQLVAGRYQYLFEEAMKAVNKVDDLFEYVYTSMHPAEIRKAVYTALSTFTEATKKVRRSPTDDPES